MSSPATGGERCRCGTRPAAGAPVWKLVDLPGPLTPTLRDHSFCSLECVRAEFLESLEFLETKHPRGVVADMEDLRKGFSQLYRHLQNEFLRNVMSNAPG